MFKTLIAILIGALLVFLFIFTYMLNKKTPEPENCKKIDNCEGCQVTSCSHNPINERKENK